MANDAGFAAAVTIRQQVLSNKLKATYADGSFPSSLAHDLPGGPPDASISFFLGEPDIACEGTTNLLVVTVPVWGDVTVTNPDVVIVQVKGVMEVTIAPVFLMVPASDTDPTKVAELTPDTVAVRTWTATVTSANPPADTVNYVTGDMFRARLETAITFALGLGVITLPQIPVDYLNGIPAFVGESDIASVAVDGALLLGFSVENDDPAKSIIGNVSALTDFAGSFDLAAAVNPKASALFFSEVPDTLSTAAAKQGATLDTSSLSITLADGIAPVSGTLDHTGGELNFSFDIIPNMAKFSTSGASWVSYTAEHWVDDPKPRIVKPRQYPALWFTTGNAQSSVDASWWTYALDAVTLGFTLLYFLPKFSNAEGSFENQVNGHPPSDPHSRVQRTAATPGGIVLRTALDSFDIKSDGISVGVHVSAKPTTIAVTGPGIIPSNYATQILHYTLRLPSGALSSDPTLRAAWTLTDTGSGAVLRSQDDQVVNPSPGFEFQPSSFASSSKFNIQVRLYRLFGTDAVDIGTATTSLQLRGALVPNAYVAWRAQSVKPKVSADTIGQWQYDGDVHVHRYSKWHRTDTPCQAAAKGVNYAGRYQGKYANTLPFPLEELDQHRPILCDYCFFGGPVGTNARF